MCCEPKHIHTQFAHFPFKRKLQPHHSTRQILVMVSSSISSICAPQHASLVSFIFIVNAVCGGRRARVPSRCCTQEKSSSNCDCGDDAVSFAASLFWRREFYTNLNEINCVCVCARADFWEFFCEGDLLLHCVYIFAFAIFKETFT